MERKTIKDIASECGVSLSTVSLVLNHNPRISEKTRNKVLAAVKKYGYEPNSHARGLASQTSRTLSIVVPHINHVFADVYFGEIVSGIYERASAKGYKVLLDIANEQFVRSGEYLNLLRSRRADGMMFIGSSIADKWPREFVSQPYPFLLINHYFPEEPLNYISIDYSDSARQAADHLLDLGHRSIGVITGTNTYTGLEFRKAFIKRCLSRGLADKDVVWADGGKAWSQEGGFEAAQKLYTRNPRLTAIMAANDRLAIGALHYLHKRKLRIPEDISVMGVDDIPQASFTTPSLTTIRHNLFQLGEMACDRILGLFRKEITSCREFLPISLVVRDSTGPAKK